MGKGSLPVTPKGARNGSASESLFRRTLDKLPAAAYLCNASGMLIYFNERAVAIWGRTPKLDDPSELYCGSYKLYTALGAPLAHDRCWMALALQYQTDYNGCEIMIERPDGSRVTALAHAAPLYDQYDAMRGAVNVLIDISEHKRIEAALTEADRTKNLFLATLSHELRNPLATTQSAAELLRLRSELSGESDKLLSIVDRQLRILSRLIDDLLDSSRITYNKLRLSKHTVELSEILEAAAETSKPLIEARRHTFQVMMPQRPVSFLADSVRLAQSIANLLNNAAKYTPDRGSILLAGEREDEYAVIRVRDNGIGISKNLLPKIFDLFAQGDTAETYAQGGLGIGLALARRLVEMHDGTIEAHTNRRGKGSEFVIRIPLQSAS